MADVAALGGDGVLHAVILAVGQRGGERFLEVGAVGVDELGQVGQTALGYEVADAAGVVEEDDVGGVLAREHRGHRGFRAGAGNRHKFDVDVQLRSDLLLDPVGPEVVDGGAVIAVHVAAVIDGDGEGAGLFGGEGAFGESRGHRQKHGKRQKESYQFLHCVWFLSMFLL